VKKLRRKIRSRVQTWRQGRERRSAITAWSRTQGPQAGGAGTVTLARVVGNDLYPRHADGQALRNLAFTLEYEPDFPNCRKLFILNRMFDEETQRQAEELVARYGHSVLVIPFSAAEYAAQACDTSPFGGDEHFQSLSFQARKENAHDRERLWACRKKICYAMNVNGARNAALDWGRQHGDWTIVLDGSCFVTASAWFQLRKGMASPPFVPHLIVPMQRLPLNEDIHRVALNSRSEEEPQIAIHSSACERFDERYPYALRNKSSLLERLGVPGAWNQWERLPWLPEAQPSAERYLYKYAQTCVVRLTSGVDSGGLERSGAHCQRYQGRNKAVFRTLAMLDDRFDSPDRDRARRIMGLWEEDHQVEAKR
jgi:hypothetical protein